MYIKPYSFKYIYIDNILYKHTFTHIYLISYIYKYIWIYVNLLHSYYHLCFLTAKMVMTFPCQVLSSCRLTHSKSWAKIICYSLREHLPVILLTVAEKRPNEGAVSEHLSCMCGLRCQINIKKCLPWWQNEAETYMPRKIETLPFTLSSGCNLH